MSDDSLPESQSAKHFFLEFPAAWAHLSETEQTAVAHGMADEIRRPLGIVVEGEDQ